MEHKEPKKESSDKHMPGPMGDALQWIRKAIDLHRGHMNGSIPTSKASQQKLMSQIETVETILETMSRKMQKGN